MKSSKITRINLENGTVIEMVQEPSTHAICEYCNKPVLFALCRKVNDLPCCIDCMASFTDDILVRVPAEVKFKMWDQMYNAGFEGTSDMLESALPEDDQKQIRDIRYPNGK